MSAKTLSSFLALATLASCAVTTRSTSSPAQLRRALREAEDRRDPTDPAVERALASHLPDLRIAALRVLARSEEVGTSTPAVRLLGDTDPEVAGWAAFALGQLADAHAEASLIESLHGVAGAPDQVLIALGRSGTASTALMLPDWLEAKDAKVRAAAALAIGLAAKRLPGVFSAEALLPRIAPLLEAGERDIRFSASYALMRLAAPEAGLGLAGLLRDVDPDIRANAARGIGLAQLSPPLLDVPLSDPDWRVRVEAVRALGKIGAQNPADAGPATSRIKLVVSRETEAVAGHDRLASGRALHVLRAAIEAAIAIGEVADPVLLEIAERLAAVERPSEETADESRAARLRARVRAGSSRRFDPPSQGLRQRARPAVAALAARDARPRSEVSTRRRGAVGLRRARRRPGGRRGRRRARRDPGRSGELGARRTAEEPERVRRVGRGELSRRADRKRLPPVRTARDLGGGLDRCAGPRGRGFFDRLPRRDRGVWPGGGPLARTARRSGARRPRCGAKTRGARAPSDHGRAEPDRFFEGRVARRSTGPSLWSLDCRGREHAGPLRARARRQSRAEDDRHVALFGALWLLQWQDLPPGGPRLRRTRRWLSRGWLGRSGLHNEDECSPARFDAGSVGIATAGRDTGGSQFFVMHSHHPHLEGAYTVAGRVLEGLEVVMALQVDDRMIGVEVRGEPAQPMAPAAPPAPSAP